MEHVVIRRAESKDIREIAEMSNCLWPQASVAEHARELTSLLAENIPGRFPDIVLVAEEPVGPLLALSRLTYAHTRMVATLLAQ
jgi:hypothetical protein